MPCALRSPKVSSGVIEGLSKGSHRMEHGEEIVSRGDVIPRLAILVWSSEIILDPSPSLSTWVCFSTRGKLGIGQLTGPFPPRFSCLVMRALH